jgi:hypothetical protein
MILLFCAYNVVSSANKWALGVTLACHRHNTRRVSWNNVAVQVLPVAPPAALTTPGTCFSDVLALYNMFQCLVEPFQNIHFTCSSKRDSHLLRCVDECHVFWRSLRSLEEHIVLKVLSVSQISSYVHPSVYRFWLSFVSRSLIKVEIYVRTFVTFRRIEYVTVLKD